MTDKFTLRSLLLSIILAWAATSPASAAGLDPSAMPQVGREARAHLANQYANDRRFKAFAIGPAGAWSWRSNANSLERAKEEALANCGKNSRPHSCVLYAVNNEVVFDPAAWEAILAPYPTAAEAQSASVGFETGNLLPDFAFTDTQGVQRKLSDYRGKVVVFHVWGSWCPPCQFEMPSLNALYEAMKDNPDIAFVPVTVKEPFADSLRWANRKGFTMPYVDGDGANGNLSTADGETLDFRKIAPSVPTTLVLDRSGIVVLRRVNSFERWEDFQPQLKHLIASAATQ
jgi:thiol-disulfide isomerase/thioredoxin